MSVENDVSRKEPGGKREAVSFESLVPFIVITFVIAWGILALFIFLPEEMSRRFGQLSGTHPLFFLAVWAPAISAFTIVALKTGAGGLRRFLARILLWRAGIRWYLFLIIGVPVIFYLGSALNGNLFSEPFPPASFKALAVSLLLGAVKGPVEEFGWRGFALPLMQRRLSPFWAGLLLGGIWGLWHLPAFLAGGTQQSGWSFLPFFIGTISISLLITALFNDSKGSILLPAIMHFQLMNPIWPDAQPYDTYLLTVAVVIVLWLKRKTIFRRGSGITRVVPRTAQGNGV